MVLALQEAAILIENVIGCVAGQALEGGVDVDEDAVVSFLLGNDDAVVGRLDHQLQEFCVDHGASSKWLRMLMRSLACMQL